MPLLRVAYGLRGAMMSKAYSTRHTVQGIQYKAYSTKRGTNLRCPRHTVQGIQYKAYSTRHTVQSAGPTCDVQGCTLQKQPFCDAVIALLPRRRLVHCGLAVFVLLCQRSRNVRIQLRNMQRPPASALPYTTTISRDRPYKKKRKKKRERAQNSLHGNPLATVHAGNVLVFLPGTCVFGASFFNHLPFVLFYKRHGNGYTFPHAPASSSSDN